MNLEERRMKLAEKFWTRLAWMLPKRLVYWASIRLMAYATVGEWSDHVVPDLEPGVALTRWATQWKP